MASVVRRSSTKLSDWVTLVERDVRFTEEDGPNLFHSLRQADYVSVLGLTADGFIPVVRQFRPALERETLELPGGLRDGDEAPEAAALRELIEETGYRAEDGLQSLGCLDPDTGRLENHMWCFFAPNIRRLDDWQPEATVHAELMSEKELKAAVADGRINHALHVALIGIALARGLL